MVLGWGQHPSPSLGAFAIEVSAEAPGERSRQLGMRTTLPGLLKSTPPTACPSSLDPPLPHAQFSYDSPGSRINATTRAPSNALMYANATSYQLNKFGVGLYTWGAIDLITRNSEFVGQDRLVGLLEPHDAPG